MFKKFIELFTPDKNAINYDDEIEEEPEYRNWWTWQYILDVICMPVHNGIIISLFCLIVLYSLLAALTLNIGQVEDWCNVCYALVVVSLAVHAARQYPGEPVTWFMIVGFLLDMISYLHYMPYRWCALCTKMDFKIGCYFIRLHRTIRFIWIKDRDTINSNLLVTALKYFYYTAVLRVLFAYFWIVLNWAWYYFDDDDDDENMRHAKRRMWHSITRVSFNNSEDGKIQLLNSILILNTIFLPIGPEIHGLSDLDRVVFLVVMIVGTLMVTGAAVASLSSVTSVYMRSEENFRTRYRIIMNDLTQSAIPESLRNKVETFYKMYWHKQRAVSASQLLPSFPPVLANSVYTDVYFQATQKSGLIRDLSYLFLSELARHMETVFYIPGDCIIKRNSLKDSIIFITYGDVEMLTAEDDESPMLRFTRGTILTPWGGCAAGGGRAHVQVRAGTFCVARVLRARALWRVALRYGRDSGQTRLMLAELRDHMNKVKRHYLMRRPKPTRYKSSILHFKKSLMALKEARGEDGELLLARPDYLLEIAGCYLMRNRADATLTDDSDPICLRQTFPCILQPTSSLLTTWNWLVVCLILIVCLIYPYNIIYIKTAPLEFRMFDIMVVAIYILDIFIYLSTGTNVEEGVPITFMEMASTQVMSVWFLVDVLATAPIFAFIENGELAGINRVFRFTKVVRMIQTLEDECVYHANAVRFFVVFLLLFFSCYFLAAVLQSFMCHGYGYCVVNNFTEEPYWSGAPLNDESVKDSLFFSMYWAMSLLTLTCHLDWTDEDLKLDITLLYWIPVIILEICTWLSIAIEAVYSATIIVSNSFRESFDSCIEDARRFLTSHHLPLQLQQRFIEHLQLCWNTRKAYAMSSKQASVFYDLPAHVYQDILARQRSRFLLSVPFLKLLHNEHLKNVSSNARIFHCAPNEVLLNTGDISTEIIIIKKGFCEVLNPDTKEVVDTLVAKSHFGVLECLFRLPAYYTVRATTHVLVFTVARKYLLEALEVPQIKGAMNFVKQQEEYTSLQTRREPFVSYQPPPPVPNRERFKLLRKFQKDTAFLQPFKKFGFFSILKNIFPRFTFRPDSALLTRYEICRSICAVVGAFIFPGYTYMVLQLPALYYVAIALDLSAYVDIVFRMFVGFFDAKGILVYHPANTAAHYLRGAFVLDLVGCLPLEGLEVSTKFSYGDLYQVTAIKQVLMLNRLLQLYRLPGTLDMLTSFVKRGDILLVLKSLPLFLTLLNVFTALLVFSSVSIYHSEDDRRWALVPFDDHGGSWVYYFRDAYRFNVTASPWKLHLACYFWIVYEATTTGYNTLAPTNLYIMGVLFWTMVLGSLLTIYMSVRIISLRACVYSALAEYQEHMKDLIRFMRRENLEKDLQKEIKNHYEFNWEKTDGIDARDVLKLCDQITLRSDAILHLYGPAFTKCPILSGSDVSLFRILGRAVRSIYFLEGTTIFQKDDVIRDLYFVYSGCLQLKTCDGNEEIGNVTKLGIGSMVGNLDDTPATRVSSCLVAATDVQLLQMRATLFHGIVRDCFPEVLQLMAEHHGNELFINANSGSNWQPSKLHITEVNRRLAITSGIVQIFLIITSLLCVYTDLYNAGFQNNSVPVLAALYLLDACFAVKILLYLTLPRYVALPTEDHEKAKETYFKGIEFILDVASCAPIEMFCVFGAGSDMWQLLSWLRLNRTLRVYTVYKYLKRYEKRATENLVFSAVTLVIWFTVYIHCFTCLWFYIGLITERTEPKQSWQYNETGGELCHNVYICSVFFVLTSFTHNGVNIIMPRTQIEVMFVSGLLIVSHLVYMVYVGEFSNIVHYASFRVFSYYSKYLELQDYMNNNRVSPVLVDTVKKYARWLWRTARGKQAPEFLIKSPVCLKLKIMNQAYKNFGDKHPVFQNCEPALLRHIVGYLRQFYYDEYMHVVKQGEITNSMYLVHSGQVQEISENYDDDQDEGVYRRVYKEGELFGVVQGIIREKPFDYSYRTTVKSIILTLILNDWEYLLKHFPNSKKLIYNYQWTSRNDDNDKPGPQPPPEPENSSALGTPGGSETLLDSRWRPPDEPSDGLPPTPPSKSPDTSSKAEDADAAYYDIKRASYSKAPQTYNAEENSLIDDREETSRVQREPKPDKLKSTISLASTDGVGERSKSALRIGDKTLKSGASVKFNVRKSLNVSSSTELFERIRNAAKEVDNRLASRNQQDHDDTPSQNVTEPTPHHSIEEYLAYKYKMRESYAYHPKRDDDDVSDTDSRMSPSRRETRTKYSTADHDGSDWERGAGTFKPSLIDLTRASNIDLDQRETSSSTAEREYSQVPMTSKQFIQQSNAVERDKKTDQFDERAISADSENKPLDRSNEVPMARSAGTPGLLALPAPSNIIEQEQSVVPPEIQNTITSETRTMPVNVLPTVSTRLLALPSSEPPPLEPVKHALPETQTPTALQRRKTSSPIADRVDSQIPMTSKQFIQESNAVEPKNDEETDQFDKRAINTDSKNKPIDHSDEVPMARSAATTELLALPAPSNIIEQEPSVVPPEIQNTIKPETRTMPVNVLPTVPTRLLALPSSEPPPLEPVKHALPETQTPTALQRRKTSSPTAERMDSQVPMTSKQFIQETNAVEPKSDEGTDQFDKRAIKTDSKNKPIDRSDEVPLVRTAAATEFLALPAPSDIIEQEQSVVPPEFQNTVKPETRTEPVNVLPTVYTPLLALPSEPAPLETVERALPETETPIIITTETPVDQLIDFLRKKLRNFFLRFVPALHPAEHAVTETLTPTEVVTTNAESSTTSLRLIEEVEAKTPIVAPSEDQATALAQFAGAKTVLDFLQPTKIKQSGETTPTETQSGAESREADSEVVKTVPDSSNLGQVQSYEEKTQSGAESREADSEVVKTVPDSSNLGQVQSYEASEDNNKERKKEKRK